LAVIYGAPTEEPLPAKTDIIPPGDMLAGHIAIQEEVGKLLDRQLDTQTTEKLLLIQSIASHRSDIRTAEQRAKDANSAEF
jgi:hypothetical protein